MIDSLITYIISWFGRFVEEYSFLWRGEYYEALFEIFYPLDGNFLMFLSGVVYALIVFLAVHPHGDADDEDMNIIDWFYIFPGESILQFLRTVLVIALINGAVNLCGKVLQIESYNTLYGFPVNNILSRFLMVLVAYSWYQKHRIRAFFFGVAVYILPIFSGGMSFVECFWNEEIGVHELYVYEILIGGVICVICASVKYFYTAWIWCFILYIGFGMVVKYIVWRNIVDVTVLSNEMIWFFAIVFAVSIFFERAIICKKNKSV